MKNPAHREILSKVPRRIRNRIAAKHVAFDLVIWGALLGGRYFSGAWWMSLLLAPVFCVFCFRSFSMMHECVHSASVTSRRFNDVLGCFYGVFCFLPFRSWRDVHLNHHMWTGNVEKDPSTRLIYNFKLNGFTTAGHVAWSWKNWVPLLAFMQHIVFWRATRSKSEGFFVALSVLFLAGAAVLLGPLALGMGLVAYLYMVEIVNFPHHLGMEQFEGAARFPATDQARFTRTCVYPKWFARFVLLNFNLHTEHHLFPAHPWYALDHLHVELSGARMILNQCESNEWILKNRIRPLNEVFAETYVKKQERDVA